jgi:hypothetical protein
MNPGDPVIYKHSEGWRPAEYLGRQGRKRLIRIRVHGARGKGLRYVDSVDIAVPDLPDDSGASPATSTAEHP